MYTRYTYNIVDHIEILTKAFGKLQLPPKDGIENRKSLITDLSVFIPRVVE